VLELRRRWTDGTTALTACGHAIVGGPTCPGRLTLVALIRETAVILRILRHLGLPDYELHEVYQCQGLGGRHPVCDAVTTPREHDQLHR